MQLLLKGDACLKLPKMSLWKICLYSTFQSNLYLMLYLAVHVYA